MTEKKSCTFFKKTAVIAGTVLFVSVLSFAGCRKQEEPEKPGTNNITPPAQVTEPAQATEPVFLWAESEMEITPGTALEGVFDNSRALLRLRCEAENGEKVLYLNGERQWSVPEKKTVLLWDMDPDDAFLELVAGEKKTVNGEERWHVTAYRVHPDGIKEISLFPSGEDNSFFISAWENLSYEYSRKRVRLELYLPESGSIFEDYELTPEGKLVVYDENDKQTAISVNGQILLLPESKVCVSSEYNVGIAFETLTAQMGTATRNVYRSEDGGRSWFAVAEDIRFEVATYEHIYILDENTIFCSMGIGAGTGWKSVLVSRDGGRSWDYTRERELQFSYGEAFGTADGIVPGGYDYAEGKEAFLKYLNFQAWYNPEKQRQEAYEGTLELYCKENTGNRFWLRFLTAEEEQWYVGVPKQQDKGDLGEKECFYFSRIEGTAVPTEAVCRRTDGILVPAVTKPVFSEETWREFLIESIENDVKKNIYPALKEAGYKDALKLEIIISDFSRDEHLWPYACLILNENEVFETGFPLWVADRTVSGLSWVYEELNYSKNFAEDSVPGGIQTFDGRSIKPLESMDQTKLERLKETASLHFVYEGEDAGTP